MFEDDALGCPGLDADAFYPLAFVEGAPNALDCGPVLLVFASKVVM